GGLATISSGGHTGSCSACCSTSPTSPGDGTARSVTNPVTKGTQPAILGPQYRPGAALDPPTALAVERAGHPVVDERHLGRRLYRHRPAPGPAHLDRHPGTPPAPDPDRYRDRDVEYPVRRMRRRKQRQP